MKNRVLLSSLAAVAGLAAAANAQTITTTASTVTMTVYFMGDEDAVQGSGLSDHDGIVEPGEGALIAFDISWTGRNTTGSWSPAQPAPPTGPGSTGTLRGLGGGFVDLIGAGGTAGAWDVLNYGNQAGFGTGSDGTPAGNNLINIQFGQLPATPGNINTTNPFQPMWTGLWIPASYAARNVSFGAGPSLAAGSFPFSVLFKTVAYGTPSAQQTISAFVSVNNSVFTPSGNIPVAPAPSSLALLGLGALVAGRRRR